MDGDDLRRFRALLRSLYNDHVGGRHHYFVLGLHERDPLVPALEDYTLTPFAGRLFVVHFEDGEELWRRPRRSRAVRRAGDAVTAAICPSRPDRRTREERAWIVPAGAIPVSPSRRC